MENVAPQLLPVTWNGLQLQSNSSSSFMLQDAPTIRYYQRLTDAFVDFWHRGYRFDDLRLYLDGYLACLRDAKAIEPYQVHRLEEEALRFLRDPSNFDEMAVPQVQLDRY